MVCHITVKRFNNLAARVRLLERRAASLPQSSVVPQPDIRALTVNTAASCHDCLDRTLGSHHHSFVNAIHAATLAKTISPDLVGRLRKLAKAADIVRHLTRTSVEMVLADLRDQCAFGPPPPCTVAPCYAASASSRTP